MGKATVLDATLVQYPKGRQDAPGFRVSALLEFVCFGDETHVELAAALRKAGIPMIPVTVSLGNPSSIPALEYPRYNLSLSRVKIEGPSVKHPAGLETPLSIQVMRWLLAAFFPKDDLCPVVAFKAVAWQGEGAVRRSLHGHDGRRTRVDIAQGSKSSGRCQVRRRGSSRRSSRGTGKSPPCRRSPGRLRRLICLSWTTRHRIHR
jgi:hypothetical protein